MSKLGPFTLAIGGRLQIGDHGCIRFQETDPELIPEPAEGKTLLIQKEKKSRLEGRILYGINGSIRFCAVKSRKKRGRPILEVTLHHHPHAPRIRVSPVANVCKGQTNGA